TNRLISESALIPFCHPLTPGSSSLPKFGTLIPNRIFVGGIPSNNLSLSFQVLMSKLSMIALGSYGFVTFESQEMAEKIIKNEVSIIFC
ncbi:unnamed protein product, partial [Schistosoma mattheei]